MLRPQPFARHVAARCPPPAALALSLAAEFHDVDAEAVHEQLEQLADLAEWAPHEPLEQLRLLGAIVRDRAAPRVSGQPLAKALHLDLALRDGIGHPAMLAVVFCEVARRLGWDVGILGSTRELHLAHRGLDRPVAVDVTVGELADPRDLEGPLRWRCSHETSATLLRHLVRANERCGDISTAIHAAELGAMLPLDEPSGHRARREVQRLRARLN